MAYAQPPAWLPDPLGRHQLRYWDGRGWTDDVSDNGVASKDPMDNATPPTFADATDLMITRVSGPTGASHHEIANPFGLRLATVTHSQSQEGQYPVAWMYVSDPANELLVTVSTKLTAPSDYLAFPVDVHDASGGDLGTIVQQPNPGAHAFEVRAAGPDGAAVAGIWGDAAKRNYQLADASGAVLGSLRRTSQQWGGNPRSTAYQVSLGADCDVTVATLLKVSPLAVGLSFEQNVRKVGAMYVDL